MTPEGQAANVIELPAGASASPAAEIALEELELVYAFIHARVGNRPDAEDLTQQVALKAIPRLRPDAAAAAIRAYLFATARTVLANFWTTRFALPETELPDDLAGDLPGLPDGDQRQAVQVILDGLPAQYGRLLELRFLRGYSLKEVAAEMGSSVGAVKVMQLRALRAAARIAGA